MTMLDAIRRIGAFLAVAAAAFTATGCGGTDSPGSAAEWVAPATATPAASGPAPLKKITSACALLPADVVVAVLGSSSGTKLTAEEQPVDQKDSEPTRGCAYTGKGREVMAINVLALRDRAKDGASVVDGIAQKSGAKVTQLDGLGDAAVTYVSEGTRFLVFAVAYESELRVVLFTGPPIVPVDKYQELAEHIAPKL
ncbi:hypothetical protein ONA70_15220 [Micromonospora yasonensis]|uniref:hypothetical protein n=1 Tax=Micromonospora yasonensis TaxID=1128667 RepID=UPI00222E9EDE|nr:hypothetical protein [Micromonospora yasonensis]MCW3841450.1 hypothetical protein [Micromonospora yasonensis]